MSCIDRCNNSKYFLIHEDNMICCLLRYFCTHGDYLVHLGTQVKTYRNKHTLKIHTHLHTHTHDLVYIQIKYTTCLTGSIILACFLSHTRSLRIEIGSCSQKKTQTRLGTTKSNQADS